jgi:hypothetical protein
VWIQWTERSANIPPLNTSLACVEVVDARIRKYSSSEHIVSVCGDRVRKDPLNATWLASTEFVDVRMRKPLSMTEANVNRHPGFPDFVNI